MRAELPLGDARLVGTGGLGFVFFQKTKEQQSLNGAASGLFEVREGRIRPSLLGGFSRSRERRGDVDVRALSVSTNGRAGVDVGVSGITSLTTWVVREKTDYASGERFLGRDLSDQLDRETTTFAAGARFDLTPLTSVVAAAALEQARFTVDRIRDADSWKLAPTVSFAEGAILNGQAFAGMRDFRPLTSALPPFRGLIAGGDVRFSVASVTRFELRGNRDLVYSYDELQPYYLDSGGQVTRLPARRRPGGRHRARRPAPRLPLPDPDRHHGPRPRRDDDDSGAVESASACDDNMRFTFTVDRERRLSTASALREFERIRAFARARVSAMTTWIRIALAVSFAASLSAQLPEPPNYVIGPEDVLTVTVFNEPSLSGRFRVENDGQFNYPFLGRVRAGGVTLSDVAATLKTKLADGYLRNPQVTVDVDQFRSQSVFVMGEVRSPGKYVLSGTVSLLEVLAQAGSTTALAGPEVVVLHPKTPVAGAVSLAAPGDSEVLHVNMREIESGRMSKNVADPRRRHHLRAQGRALLRGRAGAQSRARTRSSPT